MKDLYNQQTSVKSTLLINITVPNVIYLLNITAGLGGIWLHTTLVPLPVNIALKYLKGKTVCENTNTYI